MNTILMPTYNCGSYISDAITSILNQTYKEFEFLIIDDGSTDNTKEIVESFEDPRISYVEKEHSGIVEALNYGLKISKYDLIGIMHADDIAHPDWLISMLNIRKNNPELDIISCWYSCFIDKKILFNIHTPECHKEIVNGLALYSLISHPGCTFSKSRILKYSEGYSIPGGIEDYALWYELRNNTIFHNVPKVLIFYRLRKTSLSRNNIAQYNRAIYSFQEQIYENLEANLCIDVKQINIAKGWREYFYGNKSLARQYWRKSIKVFFRDYRVIIAYTLSFLPSNLLSWIIESRIRFRINYILNYFSKENKKLRYEFNNIFKQ